MDFQFIIARLFLLIQNHVPHVFFSPTETHFAAAFVLQAPASSLLICPAALPAQSPRCQVSGSVYFLQLFSPHIKVKADIPVRPLLSVKMDFHCGQKYKYLSCDPIQKTEFKQSPLSVFTHNKCKNTLLVYFL